MKIAQPLFAVLAAALLSACRPQPTSGIIVRKDYRPPYTSVVLVGGKNPVPVTVHHPASWDIVIQVRDTTDDTGQRLVFVTEQEWNSLEVGDEWDRAYVAVGSVPKAKPEK